MAPPIIDVDGRRAPAGPPRLPHFWDIVRRRWPLGLTALVVVVSGITAGVVARDPVYRASGLLEIRRESAAAVPVASLFTSERVGADDLETQYGVLKSRVLAERVVAAIAAYRQKGGVGWVEPFRQALVVSPQKGSRLVEVAYAASDPRLAAFTVNSVLDTYLQLRMEEARRSADWLRDQLGGAQRRLEDTERRLQEYVRAHGLQALETGKGETAQLANERLKTLHEALAAAQAERIEKQSADEESRRVATSRGVDSPVVQNLSIRLADLRREHAKLSSTFKEDYPAVRTLNDQIAELERALDEESRHVVSRGQRDYRAALKKEALLRKALDEQSALVRALGAGETGRSGYQALTRELLTSQEEFAVLNQKLKEVSISAALKAANVGIVDRAKPPLTPEGLPFLVVLGLSTFVGLLTAAGVMFVRDQLDTSMRTAADVQAYLGVRPIGAIPAVQGRRALGASPPPGWRRLDEGRAPQSVLSEAFATLRNTMLVQDGAGRSRVLLVTSAHSEEGKTTISINLSLSLARLGYRVLLVDGNLRYPCVRRALGLPDRLGVSEYLDRGEDWRSSLHRQVEPNLDVLGGTEPQVSPADLLSLPSMQELLDRAGREYDFVLVDSPAMLCHPADVHSLAAIVDNVLFVIRQGSTPRAAASLALSQLDRVSGVILNRSSGAHAVADTGVP